MNSIANKTQSLTTADDMRNQTKLLMLPYANWEEYLTPAPLSIAILGELAFISSSSDFFINKNPPIGGYKYIKHPDSFHVCLMQVCDSDWGAFNEANKNMELIRLHTANVPGYMKTAVKILFLGDEVIEALLPDQLENIKVIADKCLQLSDSTEKCFSDVINTIQELLEMCVPPMMQKEENKSENMSPSQRAADNARLAIEQARAQMDKARETYEKSLESLENNQKELDEIMATMGNYKPKEIDFQTTIEMPFKGMDAMGRVKEQWEKMAQFFQMVSYILKNLSTTLSNFVSTSEKTQPLSYDGKLFAKDLLYTQTFQACNIASLVNMISGAYTEIFNKYLMGCVSSLIKLMAMDPSKPEFECERHQLQDSCDVAQRGILKLVLKNKEEFDKESTARLEKIDRELLAILPAIPPEKIKIMEDAVKAGFCEEDEASFY